MLDDEGVPPSHIHTHACAYVRRDAPCAANLMTRVAKCRYISAELTGSHTAAAPFSRRKSGGGRRGRGGGRRNFFRRQNCDAILLSCFVTRAVVYAGEEEPEIRGGTGPHASRESRSIQGQTERSINTLSSCRLKMKALCLEGLPTPPPPHPTLFLFFEWGTFKIYECVPLSSKILAFNFSSPEILTAARREDGKQIYREKSQEGGWGAVVTEWRWARKYAGGKWSEACLLFIYQSDNRTSCNVKCKKIISRLQTSAMCCNIFVNMCASAPSICRACLLCLSRIGLPASLG